MAHAELPEEELQPLLKSIQEAFLPLQKAMPLIMRIIFTPALEAE